jgi:hypothetical protein
VNEKKHLPGLGDVNIPVVKSMAPPTFTLLTSNGIGMPVAEKVVFFWT